MIILTAYMLVISSGEGQFKSEGTILPTRYATRYAVLNACYNSSTSHPNADVVPLLICLGYPKFCQSLFDCN